MKKSPAPSNSEDNKNEEKTKTENALEHETLSQIRYYFGLAPRAYRYWQEGWQLLQKIETSLPILEAYHLAWKAIEARYLKTPSEQLARIHQVLPQLTLLTRNHPELLEIFFIRTALISHLPPLFNMQLEASRDTSRLIAALESEWNTLAPPLKETIIRFLNTSIYVTPPDKRKIQAWITQKS